ncbi:MAG: hypothetical protein J7K73_04400, partial [Nanoarchaeota archaeon]|nr:hypothetical protein [Nanoarchaeota archaeon]
MKKYGLILPSSWYSRIEKAADKSRLHRYLIGYTVGLPLFILDLILFLAAPLLLFMVVVIISK